LIRILSEPLFFRCQRSKEREASHAVPCDSFLVDLSRPASQLPQVVPVEVSPLFKLLDQGRWIERVACLPEFDDNHTTNLTLIERSGCEHAEVVNVTGLVALVASPDFLGKNLIESQASDFSRREWEELEVALLLLPHQLSRQSWRLASADLQLDLAYCALVPVMGIGRIHAPRERVLRLVEIVYVDTRGLK